MPYFITDKSPDCSGWAVVKEDGEQLGCHQTKQDAIDQMVALSIAEDIEPGGERNIKRDLPENYRPALAEDVPDGRACGNCIFFDEDRQNANGTKAWCERWEEFVDGGYYCNSWQPDDEDDDEEDRQVNLTPPAYMRAAARRGLELNRQGYGGDGLTDKTLREAREMAAGRVSADKWVRIAAWIARHMPDLDAPKNSDPNNSDYPGPGLVAHLLWGSGPSKRAANRAMKYAEGVVERIRAEENRNKWSSINIQSSKAEKEGQVNQVERRVKSDIDFEIRMEDAESDGMRFSGYAAVFNSDSEPLPFTERILPGAFKRSLKSRNEIKLFKNHNMDEVLGSTRSKTLRLTEDSNGLLAEAVLPNTTAGRDLAELMKRGDVHAMSFGFTVPPKGDKWNSEGTVRELREIRLHEVSIVTGFPAYEATTASVRSLDNLATRTNVDVDALADVITKLESGETLPSDQADLLVDVVSKLREQKDDVQESVNNLDIMKKQLDLIYKAV